MDEADLKEERRRLADLFDVAPSRILHALCALAVPDLIPPEGIGTGRLASAAEADPGRLTRLVLAAETLGVLRVDASGTVRLTEGGRLLRSDHPDTLRPEFAETDMFLGWGAFAECVAHGGTSYERARGGALFERIGADPASLDAFHSYMRTRAAQLYAPLVPYLCKRGFGDVVDVAGGTGGLTELLLAADDALRVTLLDRPEVIERVPHALRARFGERLVLYPGDMLRSDLPPGHDAYLLGSVLHDWADEEAVAVLRRCHRALDDGGRIVLLERVLSERGPDRGRLADMWMMAITGGRERTLAGWNALAAAAGLVIDDVHDADGEVAALVLVPDGAS
ncbi:methyltransferase [Streptomyces caatingaensis]|uniref:methyltransferase n=1 Tax=Streptomyces caatingaensis TaxID=1678637 RepID=UPI0006727626|nr:methyltransferase [Streptomyces caatingaensis]